MKIKRIGNLYYDNCGGNFAGNVYSVKGIAPAVMHSPGGNKMPLLLIEYKL